MAPLTAADDDAPLPRPSLWRDLSDGTVGWFVRLLVCVGVGIFLAGGAMVMSYLLAAVFPGFNRTYYNYIGPGRVVTVSRPGVYPKDGLVAAMMMLAGALWMGSILWLFFRGVRQRPFARPILLTMTIVAVTAGIGILAETSLRGDRELIIIGVALVGAASVLILWVQALRQVQAGRPLHHHQDKLLDVRCPECGYRMVGLHESRCPECGKLYTLDQLLARQNFARPEPPRPAPPATVTYPAAPPPIPPPPDLPPATFAARPL
jgi:hypothetical protein